MIDLSRKIEKPYEIRLEDKSILKIKKPSQALLLELAQLKDIENDSSTAEFALIEKINSLLTRIFNRNTTGRVFTEQEVAEMVDFETAILILQDYLQTCYVALGE